VMSTPPEQPDDLGQGLVSQRRRKNIGYNGCDAEMHAARRNGDEQRAHNHK